MKNMIRLSAACLMIAFTSCTKEKDAGDELKEAASGMNKMMPQMLSEGVRLDSVSALPDKVFKYNYTLTEDVKESVSPEEIDAFKKEAKEGALQAVKTSQDMKEFRDHKVTLKYSYADKNGQPTAEFTITPEEYGAQ